MFISNNGTQAQEQCNSCMMAEGLLLNTAVLMHVPFYY